MLRRNFGRLNVPAQQSAEDRKQFEELKTKAEKGDGQAQCDLGIRYYRGEGVLQDRAEAVKWFRKAADQGDASAQCHLGACYAKGEGVPQTNLEAYVWFSLAAAQGNTDAAQNRNIIAKRLSSEEVTEGNRRVASFVVNKSSPPDR